MHYKEYRELTKRTCPDLGSELTNSIHMVLGLGSELEELYTALEKNDFVNVSEELADGLWYATNYCNLYGIEPEIYPAMGGKDSNEGDSFLDHFLIELVKEVSKLIDLDKKLLAYKKNVDISIRKKYISNYFRIVNEIFLIINMNIEQSMQNNIDKLLKRFPDKFTEYLANNRNLDVERIELAKGIDDKN